MIKHLGEEPVTFINSGFARTPETPLENEAVTVRCRMDDTEETPALTLRAGDGQMERVIEGTTKDGQFYTFELGAFPHVQTIEYKFSTQSEHTRWFSFDVSMLETVKKPLGLYRDGDTLRVALCKDVSLAITGGESLVMELIQAPATGEPCGETTITLPDGFSFVLGSDSICTLNRLSEIICTCEGFTFQRNAQGRVSKAAMRMHMTCAHIFGAGERFDTVELNGHTVGGLVEEKFTFQGEHTYLPMPFFLTDKGFGWYRASSIPVGMRFGAVTEIEQETEGELLTRDELYFGSPMEVLRRYIVRTGRPELPPEWAFGVWISANGWKNDAEVEAQLTALKRFRYPASVLVLEQWSDERTFYRWHDTNWKDPAKTVQRMRDAGLHLVLWQIPVVKHQLDGDPGETLTRDTLYAIENGYVVRSADGTPYRLTDRWFRESYLLDFTNPEAVRWWFDKRKPLLEMGVEGFKTDGGEFLFEKTARLADGSSGLASRNRYPALYIGAYHTFMHENGINGVTFSRAGYAGAQTQPIHWAGDQKSEWSEFRACLNAGISAGLSGVLFWSFDIGGFAGLIPDAELYLRSTAMGCFCPVMQWHAEPRYGQFEAGLGDAYNNDRSPWNLAEKLEDERVLTVSCAFARLHETLRPYLWTEAQNAVQTGRPMMAHLCLDYPDDPRAWTANDQYMLGRDLLVAPLTHEGEDSRTVYLPTGSWTEFFTGEVFEGPLEMQVVCPLERIPVYRKEGAQCRP
ncbi:MAG: glycosyl hydrolase [Eubacteriales bacterium]|nr:glycosyl hydrolase [Eubacteriales bacterium]